MPKTHPLPCPRVDIIRSAKNKEYYARLIAKNGRETWKTSESYKRKSTAYHALSLIGSITTSKSDVFINKKRIPIYDHTRLKR